MALIPIGIFFTGLARLSIASRVAYAFARDGGLSKSFYWNHLQSRRKTLQRVLWLVTAACMSSKFHSIGEMGMRSIGLLVLPVSLLILVLVNCSPIPLR